MAQTGSENMQPAWVCDECGKRYGRRSPAMCTMHMGTCGVCGGYAGVTEPRDYGYLRPGWRERKAT